MQRLKTVTRHPACQICCRWENAWRDTVTKRMSLYANEGRTQGPRVLSDSRTEKNRGSQATDMKISFSRITKIGKNKSASSRKDTSRLHTSNHIPKLLSIYNSNDSEDLHLKIAQNRVVKSRISVIIQVLHGSRKTLRSPVTKNNFLNSRFTDDKNYLRAMHAAREYLCTTLTKVTCRFEQTMNESLQLGLVPLFQSKKREPITRDNHT